MSDNLGEEFDLHLYELRQVPPYVVFAALVWVIHDYCENSKFTEFASSFNIFGVVITLEDEITYFWSRRPGAGGLLFFWIRYYTIFLVIFDTINIHWVKTRGTVIYSLILGAISLWSIEIIMQLRVYVLFHCSKRIAFVNGVLFIISIGLFLWILSETTLHHNILLVDLEQPLRCPPLMNEVGRWVQWVPATIFEFVLFGMAVYKTIVSSSAAAKVNGRRSLTAVLLQGNIVYFFLVACVFIFNNLMVACQTHVPWFGLGPFHAAPGIVTCRMLIHLRKFDAQDSEVETDSNSLSNLEFQDP